VGGFLTPIPTAAPAPIVSLPPSAAPSDSLAPSAAPSASGIASPSAGPSGGSPAASTASVGRPAPPAPRERPAHRPWPVRPRRRRAPAQAPPPAPRASLATGPSRNMRWSPRRGRSAEDPFAAGRAAMVERQLRGRGVTDERVLAAMGAVPRERFVPVEPRSHAYDDAALPIEGGQAISQPYIVAWMTELLQVLPGGIVLEIGTGSGYQAAVLATIGARVRSIERLPELAAAAPERVGGVGLGGLGEGVVGGGRPGG